jgi:hypothetical protein
VNYVHPFREGNGRTQLFYLAQLAAQVGHPLDLVRLDPQSWTAEPRAAHNGDYTPMSAGIAASSPAADSVTGPGASPGRVRFGLCRRATRIASLSHATSLGCFFLEYTT